MAKTGFWLRGAKGKLAGATIYKGADGSTQMREIVSPSNPQTERQLIQRIIMLTVAQAYSKMKSITDHSFEGVQKGQATMSTFMSQNLDFLRNKVAQAQEAGNDLYDIYNFLKLGQKGFVPNGYQISRGSLPVVAVTLSDAQGANPALATVAAIQTNTYQGVCDALGLQRGDQLTFIALHVGPAGSVDDPAAVTFDFARVILDPTNADGTQAAMSSAFISNGAVNLPSVRNEGSFNALAIDQAGGLTFGFKATSVAAAGIIASRQASDDKWLRSNCFLTTRDNLGIGVDLGTALDKAVAGSRIYAPSEQYLNNAGVGGNSGSGSGSNPPSNPPSNGNQTPTDGD